MKKIAIYIILFGSIVQTIAFLFLSTLDSTPPIWYPALLYLIALFAPFFSMTIQPLTIPITVIFIVLMSFVILRREKIPYVRVVFGAVIVSWIIYGQYCFITYLST